jgi:hypothetical protein
VVNEPPCCNDRTPSLSALSAQHCRKVIRSLLHVSSFYSVVDVCCKGCGVALLLGYCWIDDSISYSCNGRRVLTFLSRRTSASPRNPTINPSPHPSTPGVSNTYLAMMALERSSDVYCTHMIVTKLSLRALPREKRHHLDTQH